MTFVLAAAAIGGIAHASNDHAATTSILSSGQPYNGDYYAAASQVQVEGTVNGDVYVAGGTVNVDGTVNGDLLVAGGTVTVDGRVTGSIREVGGTLIMNGEVDRNVSVAGGMLEVAHQADIHGNVLAAGGTVNVNGAVNGNLTVAAGSLTLESAVGGSVDARTNQLNIGPAATIGGNLHYVSKNSATIDSGAKVSGTTTRQNPPQTQPHQSNFWLIAVWRLLAGLVAAVVLVWLLPRFLVAGADTLASKPWQSLGLGFAGVILVPVLAIVLFITVIGAPLGGLLLIADILGLVLAQVVIALWLGRWIGKQTDLWSNKFAAVAVGVLIYWLLSLVPFLNGIVIALATLIGYGAVVQSLYRHRRAY